MKKSNDGGELGLTKKKLMVKFYMEIYRIRREKETGKKEKDFQMAEQEGAKEWDKTQIFKR